MLAMYPPMGLIILCVLVALAAFVVWLAWQSGRSDKTANWPVTEATIQSVNTVVVSNRGGSYTVDVGDFSYAVNDEYYSGRIRISASHSANDRVPRALIHQKIQVLYDPQKPEEYSVNEQEIDGFRLNRWYENFGTDVDPIDLNIDKI